MPDHKRYRDVQVCTKFTDAEREEIDNALMSCRMKSRAELLMKAVRLLVEVQTEIDQEKRTPDDRMD